MSGECRECSYSARRRAGQMDKAGPSTIDSVSVVQHPSPFVMHLYDKRYIFTHRKPG